ncbi:SHOCT domain-containing protein [Gordonia sp. PDNC005]|uniref:SHOCT domain-containing protein n=1 Tax=unclassified Gordonia (in: high G+C Gram-positive bacteria) TaxID=2657482 RepID=UPI0019633384|nr:SHOCT domain-containing protein [Gordonia sp. PDNC005]QRY61624.1 SHOCT domain-containing protein [Gordonia sp. PDNC005]
MSPFLRVFLKSLAFMLVAGAVGPAFLIIYFLMGDEGPSWMLWNGIGWTAVDVIAAYVFARFTVGSAARTSVLQASGVPGLGHIVGMHETGMLINDRRVVKFTLRVTGPRVSEFTTEVSAALPVIASGAIAKGVLGVFVGDDGASASIDWDATGLYTGTMPAKFESSADGRTYDLTGNAEALVQIVDVLRRNGIALNSMIDVRSNPAVRDEVMAIVHRYGDAPTVVPSPSTPQADTRTLTQRLTELDSLFSGGRITREEYERLRAKAIDAV